MKLEIVPIFQDEAFSFVQQYHRHHKPPVGSVFQVAAAIGQKIVGVAIVGRPVSKTLDNGWTLEVTRLCTDGTENACSKLYAACWRITKELGYKKLQTYILQSEPGTSVIAAGAQLVGIRGGGTWQRRLRPRVDKHPTQKKLLFEWIIK